MSVMNLLVIEGKKSVRQQKELGVKMMCLHSKTTLRKRKSWMILLQVLSLPVLENILDLELLESMYLITCWNTEGN